ncbi:S41 family peptidase [Marinicella sediminis]|uniref:S41 family peptidase n=1 Tax=Marinicella sediminis TaxID=1792834 RepID=A0ABV7JDV0_9GAMM|nr:S41 family peptidase [Marinicella sediminis]
MKNPFTLLSILLINMQTAQANHQAAVNHVLAQIQSHHAYLDEQGIDMACLSRVYRQTGHLETSGQLMTHLEQLMLEFADNHMHLQANTRDSYRLYGPIVVSKNNGGEFLLSDYHKNQLSQPESLPVGARLVSINEQSPEAVIEAFPTRCLDKTKRKHQEWIINKTLAGIYHQPRKVVFATTNKLLRFDLNQFKTADQPDLLTSRTEQNLGIITVNNSLGNNQLISAFDQAIDELQHTRGMVLDLRNTIGGGDSYIARAIMSRLISQTQPYQVHRFIEQYDEQPGIPRRWIEQVEPRGRHYDKPMVVLVNHWTGSMGEGLAIGLQGMGRATVAGTKMAGLLGAVQGFDITHLSYGFQMPVEQLRRVDGTPREQVKPDLTVLPDESAEDNVLAAAIKYLLKAL